MTLRTCSKARPAANMAKLDAKTVLPVAARPAATPIILPSAMPQSKKRSGNFSIYLTKDVLFGCIMAVLIMKLYDLVESKGVILENWQQCVQIAILFLLSSMLRNNGFYILMCMAVILFVMYRKYWKQLLMIVGSVFMI